MEDAPLTTIITISITSMIVATSGFSGVLSSCSTSTSATCACSMLTSPIQQHVETSDMENLVTTFTTLYSKSHGNFLLQSSFLPLHNSLFKNKYPSPSSALTRMLQEYKQIRKTFPMMMANQSSVRNVVANIVETIGTVRNVARC